jgi:ERF superfamily
VPAAKTNSLVVCAPAACDDLSQENTMNAVVEARPVPAVETQSVLPITPMQMLEAAVARGTDIEQLTKLMDLQDRWEKNEARKAFVTAMTQFKANPPEILKSKHVSFETSKGTTEYKHATLADVCEAAIRGLALVGISHRWDVRQEGDRITVTCVLTHEQGHSESVPLTASADSSGGKNAIQAVASAVTYLQRYTLLSATGLASKDMQEDDGRATSRVEVITASQVADLEALITEVGANRAAYLNYCKVERIEDLPASKFNAAVKALEARRK